MDRPLRIGVIGAGQRAALATLVQAPGDSARVVSVADPSPRGKADARHLFGESVAIHDHHDQVLSDGVDAVMVFTPDHLHTGPVLAALRAGVAVFVEKPLAITTEDCDLMLTTARATGSRLYVGHNMRHAPVVTTMRRLISEDAIGAVKTIWCRHFVGNGGDFYFSDWHAERAKTTSLLLQKGAHDLDVIHWLADGYTRRVTALGDLMVYGRSAGQPGAGDADRALRAERRMSDWYDPTAHWPPASLTGLNPVIDVEDVSMLTARLSNGILASYQQCHFTPDYWRNYTVIGDAGRLENFGDLDGAVVKVWNTRRAGYQQRADIEIEIPAGDQRHGGADDGLVAEFLRFVRHGGRCETSPVAAREAVAAGVAATRSLRADGEPVDVSGVPDDVAAYFEGGQPGARTAASSPASSRGGVGG